MSNRTFLIEIGLEEMPARFITDAMNQLEEKMTDWLGENRLNYTSVEAFSTPRRLAVLVSDLAEKQDDRSEEAKGPSKKIALDDEGNWSKAAQGFARGQKCDVNDLYFKDVKGEEYVFVTRFIPGKASIQLLSELHELISGLTFPKNMRWGSGSLRYVRPIKWVAALFGNEIVDMNAAGVQASNVTYGHRFLGDRSIIEEASDYRFALLKEHVLADPVERKQAIRKQLEELAASEGWVIPIDEDLLEEVNNLVEYPTVLYGTFDESFLRVPDDVLVTSMKEHQRYFPVQDSSGNLLPYFVTVRNGDHRHLENVQKGNEKVLRARLADSEFFFNEDLKLDIDEAAGKLENVVYHEELGSIGDKVRRVKTLALTIADRLNLGEQEKKTVERAAQLSKFDLVTHMVDEFPELEGRMGEVYAEKAGESSEVTSAIREHYLPRHGKDDLPGSAVSAVISVADKLDTVVTSFGIGQIPTGSQDPHGLRRLTAGAVAVLHDRKWNLELPSLFDDALSVCEQRGILKRSPEEVKEDLLSFARLRIKTLLQERGVRYDMIEAVLSAELARVDTLVEKGVFLTEKAENSPEFKGAVEAFSRVTNIASKAADSDKGPVSDLFEKEEERELFEKTAEVKVLVKTAREDGNPAGEFEALRKLEPAIHTYFDNIMVMAKDEAVKKNRLAQMKQTAELILSFADFQAVVFHSES
ncbi:glycine--tRNA ligase subunit beta [Alteribacter natronophilus]|uniref:glycine--tRNA ligase subunit beta n=1 Tax=Alteribacter natronophilus TaxID=2583810 RepID=UPI00110E3F30|nr:glycine--tRNA ligase subunit beta [Alteribacter natronophilus]TMW73848.1 glycine--tRNA ligase subunit beta [Alteribacter natronophilus]